MRPSGVTALVVALLAVPALGGAADRPPGPLDPGFGTKGVVLTPIGPPGTVDVALGMAVQPDGKYVLAGNSGAGGSFGSGGDFALARFNPNGTLDPTFGSDGIVTTDVDPRDGEADEAHAVAIQPDGKIVAVGVAGTGDTFTDFAVVRYNADGSLDTSFDGDGIVLTDVAIDGGTDFSNAWAVALQDDGKVVVAGEIEYSLGFALVRYNQNGSLDTTFGDGGIAITQFCSGDMCDGGLARAVIVQPNGRIVAAGTAQIDGGGTFTSFFALARYNANGTLDPSFGGDGKVTTPFGGGFPSVGANDLVLLPDGKLVAAGSALVGGQYDRFGLVRYNPDGSLDATFGDGGKVMTNASPIGNSSDIEGLARADDGRLVAVGSASDSYRFEGNLYMHKDFAVARYAPDGNLDRTFAGDGVATTPLTEGYTDMGRDVAVLPDGKIVAAGYSDAGLTYYDYEFALVRYADDSSPPDTGITKGPSGRTKDRTPTFGFRSPDDPTARWFRCRVDSGKEQWCSSPMTLKKLSFGRHTFRARAVDAAGNEDASPATRSFRVVR